MRSPLFTLFVVILIFSAISCEKKTTNKLTPVDETMQIKDDFPSFFEQQFLNEQRKLEKWIAQYYENKKEQERRGGEDTDAINMPGKDNLQIDKTFSVLNADDKNKIKDYCVVISTLTYKESVKKLDETLKKRGVPFITIFDNKKKHYLVVLSCFDTLEQARNFRSNFIDESYANDISRIFWNDLLINVHDAFIMKLKRE